MFSFFDSVERFADDKYIPSNQDILMTRFATTKISETLFDIQGAKYQVVDVGGQTKYRTAWPRFFDSADAILFIVSLASYNQYMDEDGFRDKNRMVDSLELFDSISNHDLLSKIPIILLMNKTDLAEEKIKKYCLRDYFRDFEGKYEKDYLIMRNEIKILTCVPQGEKYSFPHLKFFI
jgi:GTPase SAR1 family protein